MIAATLRAAFAGAWLLAASLMSAQEFTLDSSTIAAGGGQSSGGDFALDATVGQPEFGDAAGGDFELNGGFWSLIAALDTPNAPPLTLAVSGGGVILSWPESAGPGFVLEETPVLETPPAITPWAGLNVTPQVINGMQVVQLPLTNGNRFYRLRY